MSYANFIQREYFDNVPKNTEETLSKIAAVPNLNQEIDEACLKEYLSMYPRDTKEDYERMKHRLGFCHLYWGVKKNLLKEKYGITWYTPSEENPTIIYD